MFNRSTSKASKLRRDLINKEIDELRELLPLTKSTKGHLSYIQVMSAACAYIRKGNYFNTICCQDPNFGETSFGFDQALPGFLIVVSSTGKLLFVSENIADYLGHSMVELISKGALLEDLVDEEDLHVMWNQLQIHPPCFDCFSLELEPRVFERSFICRMLKSQCFKRRLPDGVPDQPENRSTAVLVRGRVHELSPADPQTVLVAICFPLVEPTLRSIEPDSYDTLSFTTIHEMDLRIKATSDNIAFFLGFSEKQLLHCSWYQFVHYSDLQEAAHLHCRVRSGCGQCTTVLRLLTRDGASIYVRTVAGLVKQDEVDAYTHVIQFNNRLLSDEEVEFCRHSRHSSILHNDVTRKDSSQWLM